jgi:carbon-monoxide dehydrogenase medium subunit
MRTIQVSAIAPHVQSKAVHLFTVSITNVDDLMDLWQKYLRPKSVEEALTGLASAPGRACPIAGGTDLLLDLQQGRHPPVHTLVDLTTIPELTNVEVRAGNLFIGAAVPLSHIVASDLVREHAQALIEAAQLVAGPQVRNTATLGGNVVHALPAADGTIALMILQAQAEIASPQGRRMVPMADLFLGPGKSLVDVERELLVGFHLPVRTAHQASAFRRIMRAQGIALPILNLSVWLERKSKLVREVRIAVGPGGPTPWRAAAAEDALRGHPYTPAALATAREALLKQVAFRTSAYRASAEYRAHLVGVLLSDTLETAWKRAEMD